MMIRVRRVFLSSALLLATNSEIINFMELAVVILSADNLDFAWDRPETSDSLRRRLATNTGVEWLRTAAWLMREARVDQVWRFLTLRQVADNFNQLSPMLGRRRPMWEYLLRAAHELGRL
jgi:hypothetical protein